MATAPNSNINIPYSQFLDATTGRPSLEWLMWLMNPSFISVNIGGALPVTSGGTGLTTIPTNGQLLIGNGTGYSLNTLTPSSGITVTNSAGTITVANSGVLSNIAGSGISVSSATGNVTINNTGVLSWSGGTTGLTPATATTGAVTLAGTLAIANGGTNGSAVPTAYGVAYGDGTAYAFTAAGTTGQVLTATTGSAPTWAAPATSGTVTSVSFTGGLITVATPTTTPALTVAGTSGGVVYFSSASTWASSAALAANALVKGGGAGVAPSTITTGTGVLTALGVNTGTAGAFVVNGGDLGTPSAGTVTNLTGTASININGTVGATTTNTGAFTSLSYTTTLTGGTGIVNLGSGQFYKDASGNVGIGTTSPTLPLDAQGVLSTGALVSVAHFGQNSGSAPTIGQGARITLSANNSKSRSVAIDGIHESGTNAHYMAFSTSASGAVPTQKLQITSAGNVIVVGAGGLGYGTGSGGTVTQGTSRTTGVTLNKTNGAITMFSAAGSVVAATFTVTNNTVAATDTIILNQKSGTNLYVFLVTAVAAGSFNITFYTTGGVATDAPVINFSVIKAVTA